MNAFRQSRQSRQSAGFLVVAGCVGALLVACGDKIVTASSGGAVPPPPTARGVAAAAGDAGALAPTKVLDFAENDFVEGDHERDPFRSYAMLFIEKPSHGAKSQLAVILPQYSIDELKLVAIVQGGVYPRAMLIDPMGKGWVVKRGDYIGRPDIVHTGGANGTDYPINWRVDRVRDGDLVLSREDRASNAPAATRVIPLHPEADKNAQNDPNQPL